MSEVKRPRGRPPKYPPREVEERLIEASIERLLDNGVDSGLDAIGLDDAIVSAGVPRGMSYRIWQDGDRAPQDALRHAVVLKLLGLPTTSGLAATKERLAKELADITPLIDSGDVNDRNRVIAELARVVGSFNHEALDSSPEWRLYNALRAAAITRRDLDPEIKALIIRGEDLLIERYAELYSSVAESLGVSLREGLTIEQFAASAYALNEGLSGRLTTSYQRDGITRRSGTEDVAEWTLFSVGLEALIRHFFAV